MILARFKQMFSEINQFGKTEKGITRLAFSQEDQNATEYFIELCRSQGLQVKVDACGNVIVRWEGTNPGYPAVALGSHFDTVNEGGEYDGTLGVMAALEVICSLNDHHIETVLPIEIIVFACEESARFGVSTIGSKALTGSIQKQNFKSLKDKMELGYKVSFRNAAYVLRTLKTLS